MTNILVIHGHPVADSLGHALASAYARGAASAGHDVRELHLRELSFDPVLRTTRNRDAALEPDLLRARDELTWARHVVIEYPTWWAGPPALLKGFIDRAFTPGFAYRYRDTGKGWDKLLAGRSARIIVTMDAPRFFDTLGYFASSRRCIAKGVLWFCGFKPVRTTCFAGVREAPDTRRKNWIDRCHALGAAAS